MFAAKSKKVLWLVYTRLLHQILYKIWGKINKWWAKSKGLDRIGEQMSEANQPRAKKNYAGIGNEIEYMRSCGNCQQDFYWSAKANFPHLIS